MNRILLLSIPFALGLLACEPAEETNDCTGEYLPDADGDGFPGMGDIVFACEQPDGYASVQLDFDCEDGDASIHPVIWLICWRTPETIVCNEREKPISMLPVEWGSNQGSPTATYSQSMASNLPP